MISTTRLRLVLTSTLLLSTLACAHPTAPIPASGPTVAVNVHAVLSEPIRGQVEDVSSALARGTGIDSFARQGFQIHTTLFMAEFDPAALPEIERRLSEVCAVSGALPVRTAGLRLTPQGWLFLDLERSPALGQLSTAIATRLAPLRASGTRPPAWASGYPEKLKSFAKYGSPNVGDQLEPHVTLLAGTDAPQVTAFAARGDLVAPPVAGKVEAIALGLADANGQMRQRLWRCALGALAW